ncbi:MAG: AAA family ATPase [Promethearchaeota archaeon]
MFVKELHIKEFRGIKNCKARIQFSNFNLLIGRNNAGKSTILEALSLLPHPYIEIPVLGGSKINFLYNMYGTNSLKYLYAGESELNYLLNNSKELIFKIGQNNNIEVFFKKNGNLKKIFNDPSSNEFINNINLERDKLSNSVIFLPFLSIELNYLEVSIRKYKELIIKKGLHIKLAKFLNQSVNDEYSEIVFLEPISLRRVYKDNFAYIKLKDLGSGAEKLIKIMAFLEIISPKLVIFDDFEVGMHPSMLRLFIKWLATKDWQVVASTHSLDVLYYVADIKPRDTTIIKVKKDNEDLLISENLSLDDLEDILAANIDPRLLVDSLKL